VKLGAIFGALGNFSRNFRGGLTAGAGDLSVGGIKLGAEEAEAFGDRRLAGGT
jgi:hypothetical protein